MNELKKFRLSLRLTQSEMAEKLEITPSHYSKIEEGVKNFSVKSLKKLKTAFPEFDLNKLFI